MLTLTPSIMNELKTRVDLDIPSDLEAGVLVHKVIVGSPAHS